VGNWFVDRPQLLDRLDEHDGPGTLNKTGGGNIDIGPGVARRASETLKPPPELRTINSLAMTSFWVATGGTPAPTTFRNPPSGTIASVSIGMKCTRHKAR